ncbi:hypothetical protein EZS27_014085 [termite gut metagenome]|uniref:Uncharacterized protein n=1 Tax=termite gut metagenome TaxID=433724 RepID=A0A5J4RWQ2_9ZZZZ
MQAFFKYNTFLSVVHVDIFKNVKVQTLNNSNHWGVSSFDYGLFSYKSKNLFNF